MNWSHNVCCDSVVQHTANRVLKLCHAFEVLYLGLVRFVYYDISVSLELGPILGNIGQYQYARRTVRPGGGPSSHVICPLQNGPTPGRTSCLLKPPSSPPPPPPFSPYPSGGLQSWIKGQSAVDVASLDTIR